MLSRYGGDSSNVSLFISDEFIYEHTPYVGLGVETRYVDESLLITKVLNDSIQKYLQVGDRVYEHNNEIVDSLGLVTNGPIGEKQKLIVIKNGERDFRVMEIPLEEYHFEENKNSFLESIMKTLSQKILKLFLLEDQQLIKNLLIMRIQLLEDYRKSLRRLNLLMLVWMECQF